MTTVTTDEIKQLYQRFRASGIRQSTIARQMGIDPSLLQRKLAGHRDMDRIEYDACNLLLDKEIAAKFSRLVGGEQPSAIPQAEEIKTP